MRLKLCEVDQRLEVLRVALVTILAVEMRLKFFEVDQRLEMLRVALVTILAREMRLKFFQVDQAVEMLRVALVTILAREMRLKLFEVDQALEMLRVALVTILAREMLEICSSRPSLGVGGSEKERKGGRNAALVSSCDVCLSPGSRPPGCCQSNRTTTRNGRRGCLHACPFDFLDGTSLAFAKVGLFDRL